MSDSAVDTEKVTETRGDLWRISKRSMTANVLEFDLLTIHPSIHLVLCLRVKMVLATSLYWPSRQLVAGPTPGTVHTHSLFTVW